MTEFKSLDKKEKYEEVEDMEDVEDEVKTYKGEDSNDHIMIWICL